MSCHALAGIAGHSDPVIGHRGITWLDALAALLGVVAVFGLVRAPQAQSSAIMTEPVPTIVTELGSVPAPAASNYADWIGNPGYYGAFATSPGGAHGWVMGNNSEAMAQATALAHCAAFADDCVIVALMEPERTADADAIELGVLAQGYYADYASRPGAAAFATAENGDSGWSWSHGTVVAAEARALAHCRSQLADRPATLPTNSCRVIHSRGWFR